MNIDICSLEEINNDMFVCRTTSHSCDTATQYGQHNLSESNRCPISDTVVS